MAQNYLERLGQYREKDEKTPQGEVIPEKETLNNARVRDFLDKKGFTVDNFDMRFNTAAALELLEAGSTRGEREMIQAIKDGKAYFDKIGEPELLERRNEASFRSTLLKELMRRKETDKEPMLTRAYETYHTVRKLTEKTLKIQQKFVEQRAEQKVTAEKGLKETFAGVIEDVKKNYAKMSSGEKLASVGALLFGAIMLVTSDNEHVKKIKEYIWTGLKLGGLAVGANYVTKLFTGKTALDSFSDWSKSTVAKDSFWMETYNTDEKKAELLRRSAVYIGDKDFSDLAKRYQDANARGEKAIKLATVNEKDMSPEEVYIALDTFFGRYKVEQLAPKYRKSKPNWAGVMMAEMAEDGRLEFEGNPAERAVDSVKEYSVRGWNGFWVTTEGIGLNRSLYLWARGKEPTDVELQGNLDKLRKQLEHEVPTNGEVEKFLDRNMSETSAKQFVRLLREGKTDSKEPNVRFFENPGDSMYVMSEAKLDTSNMASEKGVGEMLTKSLKQAEDFLKRTYPDLGDNFYKFVNLDEVRGVRVAENATFKLFIRMPIKGSAEYTRKAVLLTPPSVREEKHGVEIFDGKEPIEYSKLEPWYQEKFRLRFLLDSSQADPMNNNIHKLCLWYTDEYKTKGLPKKEVMRILFEDDKVREKALQQTGVEQKLKGGVDLLASKESQLSDIEDKAARGIDFPKLRLLYPPNWFEKVDDAYQPLMEQMKRNLGYKIRLAVMGDTAAREYFSKLDQKYNPLINAEWMKDLFSDYEKRCKQLVDDYGAGRARLEKP